MAQFLSIQALHEEGHPKKAIARKLGIDVRTVRKHLRRIEAGEQEPRRETAPGKLTPFLPLIEAKVEQGLSAVQIYQDLCTRPDFDASYETVKRQVRPLRPEQTAVYCRVHHAPGEEAQIDFGDIGRLRVGNQMRRAYLFVLTLCFSRMGYYELVLDQRVPTFLGAIRRAFEFLGGVPATLKPDNLRSAVLLDQLGQRYYQEDFFHFCRHYGTVPDAARPFTPTDKGCVERDIRYAKGNALRGRDFEDFDAAQAHLARWRDTIANVRLHGTTRRRPVDLFKEERPVLRPLADDPYEICHFGHYRVRKDCHFQLEGNHYSAPHELVGQKVLVRIAEHDVQVLVDREVVARHARCRDQGTTVTDPAHYPPTKRLATQEIHRRRVLQVREAGPHAAQLVHALRQSPFVMRDQLLRLIALIENHGGEAFDRACARALHYGATEIAGVAPVERILEQGLQDVPFGDAPVWATRSHRASDYGRALREYDALFGAGEELQ